MEKILIIAEAGVNHNGSLSLAEKMISTAAQAGVDIIKFQTFHSDKLVSRNAKKADYQQQTTTTDESQLAMLRKLELPDSAWVELIRACQESNLDFLSTPFDLQSIDFLSSLEMPFWKVPSGEVTNLPYLVKIAQTAKPVIMSTGMCTLAEVESAVNLLQKNGTKEISLLHCNTEYPTPYEDVNLHAMLTLKREFGFPVGYSDHTQGIEIPIAAAALGAVVIEKHFTLDRSLPGPDHKASLEPDELESMVTAIRHIEKALGNGDKAPSPSEKKNVAIARKSIVASRAIHKGEIFSDDNITAKRPGSGISPMRWYEVSGKAARRDFQEDELIEL